MDGWFVDESILESRNSIYFYCVVENPVAKISAVFPLLQKLRLGDRLLRVATLCEFQMVDPGQTVFAQVSSGVASLVQRSHLLLKEVDALMQRRHGCIWFNQPMYSINAVQSSCVSHQTRSIVVNALRILTAFDKSSSNRLSFADLHPGLSISWQS